MSITLFQDKKFKDRSMAVTGDVSDLQDVSIGKNPSSIQITGGSECILLFSQKKWDGDVLYLRGPVNVSDLGDKDAGGELGFSNSARSVRVTPFRLRLNVSVVQNESGELPGQWTPGSQQSQVQAIVTAANAFFAAQRTLFTLEIARVVLRTSNRKYNLNVLDLAHFPNEWRNPGEIDVIIVNQYEKDGRLGVTRVPHSGKTVSIAASYVEQGGSGQTLITTDEMAEVLCHELGHYLGLEHNTANGASSNIMFATTALNGLSGQSLTAEQIHEMQTKLAREVARGADRHE